MKNVKIKFSRISCFVGLISFTSPLTPLTLTGRFNIRGTMDLSKNFFQFNSFFIVYSIDVKNEIGHGTCILIDYLDFNIYL